MLQKSHLGRKQLVGWVMTFCTVLVSESNVGGQIHQFTAALVRREEEQGKGRGGPQDHTNAKRLIHFIGLLKRLNANTNFGLWTAMLLHDPWRGRDQPESLHFHIFIYYLVIP